MGYVIIRIRDYGIEPLHQTIYKPQYPTVVKFKFKLSLMLHKINSNLGES